MGRWLESLTQDLGYAIRSFRRSPLAVLVALASLTLGIGNQLFNETAAYSPSLQRLGNGGASQQRERPVPLHPDRTHNRSARFGNEEPLDAIGDAVEWKV